MLQPAESLDEVVVDFSGVTYVDASVLGTLVRLRARMVEHGRLGIICIVAASRHIVHLFEICELQELFEFRSAQTGTSSANGIVKLKLVHSSPF
jgi:anti-anti-sigma factor